MAERTPPLPVLIISGFEEDLVLGKINLRRDNRFIRKPFRASELPETMKNMLL